MGELKGRVALVTGAARNIGRAIALELASAGACVTIGTHSALEAAEEVVTSAIAAGGSAFGWQCDVSEPAAVRAMVQETVTRFGGLDILVNNAGIRPENSIEQITLEEWDQVLAVNLDGPFFCIQAALPYLSESQAAAVVNIGGLTAYTGAVNRAHVVASKAGLDGLTKALALELAPRGITVNLVSPGLIETERGKHGAAAPAHHKTRTTLLGRRGRPEEVAAMVRHLVGPAGRYITGQSIHVNGGLYLS